MNYGNITCFTPGGSVGGNIGKIWENNCGDREWRFCFNFGHVKKYDSSKKEVAGSGLIGNYTNTEGDAVPNILGCGNARKADTGTLLDELSWNYDDSKTQLPLNIVGAKTNSSENYYTSIKKDKSAASWWTNYSLYIYAAVVLIALAVATGGLAVGLYGAAILSEMAADAMMLAVMGAIAGGLLTLALTSLPAVAGYSKNDSRLTRQAEAIANTPINYTDNDIRCANFAFDANLMMQADSIGGEANTDKSPLFKQHVNKADANLNDSIPSIVTDFNANTDKLYFGYDKCNRIPFVNNDPSLGKKPTAHTFDEHGECTYCHFTMEPLEAVYQADGQVDYYAIKNYAQLNYLASAFNGDNEEAYKLYKGANFKLMNDIDYPANFLWTPIGSCTVDYSNTNDSKKESANWHHFTGKFDGQGHTIKGLQTEGHTNYAGLFGYVDGSENTTYIKNVTLSNCQFFGNVSGSIAGCTNTGIATSDNTLGKLAVESVAADSSVLVVNTSYDKTSYAGGLLGMVNRAKDATKDITVRYSYSNAILLSYQMLNAGAKEDKTMGTLAGLYDYEPTDKEANPTFQHCYYGGVAATQQTLALAKKRNIENYDLDDCYSIGEKKDTISKNSSSYYVPMDYMASGHLAYDLMNSSKVTENGVTTYFFTQKGNYPVLTNTKQPTLCKVIVGERNTGVQIADTIINIHETKLAAPIEYAGKKFDKTVLYGWNNEKCEGDPVYKGQLNDFSELYKTPTRYYALVLNPENIPAIANIQSETEWKGAGVLAGYQLTNIMEDLYLQGSDAWSLQLAPQCIDGNNKTVRAGMPLISNVEDATSAARRYSRARGVGARASQESADITIQNLRVQADTLTQDLLSKGARKLNLNNLILEPVDADETIFDWNSATKTANTNGLNLKNVVCRKNDSTSVAFYKDGTDVMATTFSDKNKNNDYEHILNYMLSQEGMLDVFGLRLSGKNEKVAGKFGFASEESKRIYRVKTYNQSTGLAEGEILMNYDGDVTFDVKGSRVGAMHEGLPDGTFAVLPLTREELGNKFQNLGKNIITKDGKAKCIRLEEDKIDGFAFPSCFNTEETSLMADCGEFVRKVRRDGSFESLILPFGFMSLDIDEKDFSESDELELCFLNFAKEENPDGVSEDGTSLKLTTSGSYAISKEQLQIDSLQDDEVALPAIPYLIRFKCTERTDETSTITFSLSDPRSAVIFFPSANSWSVFDPMFGVFQNSVVSELEMGKDKKVYTLESLMDETTGKPYANFTKAKPTDHIKAFHCYLATSLSLAGDNIKVTLDDGTTTGINGILNSNAKSKNKIYDMLGRRVTKKTPRNIYIQNGKKVVNF